jgi:hypothetical protein
LSIKRCIDEIVVFQLVCNEILGWYCSISHRKCLIALPGEITSPFHSTLCISKYFCMGSWYSPIQEAFKATTSIAFGD